MTNYAIAKELGVDEASVRRGLAKVGYKPYLLPSAFQRRLAVSLEKPITIDVSVDGGGAITSDFHIPLTNWPLVNSFIEHAREVGATKWCAVAGDFFNIDSLSQFDFKQEDSSLAAEQYGGTAVMKALLETFDRILFSWGNHDARVHKALGYKIPFAEAMQMMLFKLDEDEMSRITFSNVDYILVKSPTGTFRVAHPKDYSATPLTNARKLASKYLQHIVTGHSHHTAIGSDPSGEFVIAELGGFHDDTKTQYLQRTTGHARWQNGYGFITEEGRLIIEAKNWSSRVGTVV